jgi:glycosyltransferase involved in cell wall biosynthesis
MSGVDELSAPGALGVPGAGAASDVAELPTSSTGATDEASTPAVSLLIPIYNVEPYLAECLDSACCQTLENIEIICINDGSNDGSLSIIKTYAERDHRFKIIDKQNSGYGASMNRGLAEAQGAYIAILEPDDFLEPNALELLYRAARQHDAQVVKANFWFYWSAPETRNELIHLITPERAGLVNPQKTHDIFWFMPSIWSAMYQRSFIEENALAFLETPGASYQDLAFAFKVWACAERVVLLEEPFVHYRQDNETSSVNSPGKLFCVCDEFAEMERFLDSHPEKDFLRPVKARLKYDSYIWNYWRLNEELRAKFLVRMARELAEEDRRGAIHYDLFQPWAEADMRAILKDPEAFHAWAMATDGKQGRLSALIRYFKLGGLPLVKKRLTYR